MQSKPVVPGQSAGAGSGWLPSSPAPASLVVCTSLRLLAQSWLQDLPPVCPGTGVAGLSLAPGLGRGLGLLREEAKLGQRHLLPQPCDLPEHWFCCRHTGMAQRHPGCVVWPSPLALGSPGPQDGGLGECLRPYGADSWMLMRAELTAGISCHVPTATTQPDADTHAGAITC